MSRAKDFLLARGKPDAVMFPAPAADDAAGILYKELLRALRARGLGRLHHACEHCGKLTTADLLGFPEIRMACTDAVDAFVKVLAVEVAKREAAAK
ncbi:MAG TPA: hypothetical protein VMW52_07190 [Phycisphaerae bacterium]|nr:hypothetical protein [Phycisphaerae bacterium]